MEENNATIKMNKSLATNLFFVSVILILLRVASALILIFFYKEQWQLYNSNFWNIDVITTNIDTAKYVLINSYSSIITAIIMFIVFVIVLFVRKENRITQTAWFLGNWATSLMYLFLLWLNPMINYGINKNIGYLIVILSVISTALYYMFRSDEEANEESEMFEE